VIDCRGEKRVATIKAGAALPGTCRPNAETRSEFGAWRKDRGAL